LEKGYNVVLLLGQKTHHHLQKTALFAESLVEWQHADDVLTIIANLQEQGFTVAAVEQSQGSVALPDYAPSDKLALLVGREVEGVEPDVLAACDSTLEIPMFGQKESFNVVQAAAMALYHCRFTNAGSQ
jgi:tRNA G18 (ribose-2'-O)-methylase SpoU